MGRHQERRYFVELCVLCVSMLGKGVDQGSGCVEDEDEDAVAVGQAVD